MKYLGVKSYNDCCSKNEKKRWMNIAESKFYNGKKKFKVCDISIKHFSNSLQNANTVVHDNVKVIAIIKRCLPLFP